MCNVVKCNCLSYFNNASCLQLQVWSSQTGREHFTLISYSCICSKHFTDVDIISHPTKWVLKNKAVPSQFDWRNKQNLKQQLLRVVPNAVVAVQPIVV